MRVEAKRGDVAYEFLAPEHCYIREIANDADDERVSISLAKVKPGVITPRHKLVDVTR